MRLKKGLSIVFAGLLIAGSPAFARANEAIPRPDLRGELMQVDGFRISKTHFPESTRIAIFFYSASWCPYCQITARQLKEVYPTFRAQYPEIELVTFSIDDSISERADYLREAKPPWLAISPAALEKDEWAIPLPKAIPQLQAFKIKSDQLVPLTAPGPADEVLGAAVAHIDCSR